VNFLKVSTCPAKFRVMNSQILAVLGTLLLLLPGRPTVVERVIDGDTVEVGDELVRLLGINTPERGDRCFRESTEALKTLVLGREVSMVRELGGRDKYGRALRHLKIGEVLVSEIMVAEGHAKALCIFPNYAYCDLLMQKEVEAIMGGRGCLFSRAVNDCIRIVKADCQGEWVTIRNFCESEERLETVWVENRGRGVVELEGGLGPGADRTFHMKLYPGDAVYLFDPTGLRAFLPC